MHEKKSASTSRTAPELLRIEKGPFDGGETGARFVCPRCQYQGIPIEFDNGDDYAAWVRELHGASIS